MTTARPRRGVPGAFKPGATPIAAIAQHEAYPLIELEA
jgi:hypothetical protein